jgi:hypothetical protein
VDKSVKRFKFIEMHKWVAVSKPAPGFKIVLHDPSGKTDAPLAKLPQLLLETCAGPDIGRTMVKYAHQVAAKRRDDAISGLADRIVDGLVLDAMVETLEPVLVGQYFRAMNTGSCPGSNVCFSSNVSARGVILILEALSQLPRGRRDLEQRGRGGRAHPSGYGGLLDGLCCQQPWLRPAALRDGGQTQRAWLGLDPLHQLPPDADPAACAAPYLPALHSVRLPSNATVGRAD